ncbi:recombination directionality factor [Streptomonospora wellingtoniae]|uniref:DUF2213 domain-containing protein n=1 Tax=Streptomonospora wellingtoniae TaxID=3075544 RepID=A0ABU2KUI1_9ACTN|nr:hypothetical protein [Streptomonospora sp. DSM 45055]MDT0302957.1 hypothetical protein [Streptomonospora sp. DSM 45055]
MKILTIDRQVRELGRLRTGYTERNRPVKSKTWIFTSPSEEFVAAAAELWGGTPERWKPLGNGGEQYRVITTASAIDCLLPEGDNVLSSAYEMWSRGGAQRRCDGVQDKLSGKPCLCTQEFGEEFYNTAPKEQVCKATTRLKVILPGMPDIGTYRVETHSYYATSEIGGTYDLLRNAQPTGVLPVRVSIEQRSRVAAGQTKHFPVVTMGLIGATSGEVLRGSIPNFTPAGQVSPGSGAQVGSGEKAAAIGAGRTEPDEDVPPIGQEQLKALAIASKRAGFGDEQHDELMAGISHIIGREVSSRTELTAAEAGPVIEVLKQRAAAARQQAATPAPEEGEPMVTDQQRQRIADLAQQMGLSLPKGALEYASRVLGRPVGDPRELAVTEADAVIASMVSDCDAAEAARDGEDAS